MDQRRKEEIFLQELNRLAVAMDADLPKAKQIVYLEDLIHYPIDAVMTAFKKARQTMRWMPRIADLVELIEEELKARPARPASDLLQLEEMRADPVTVKRAIAEILSKIEGAEA